MCLCTNIELLNTKLQTVHYSKVPIHVSGSWNETSFKNKHVQWNHLRQTASEHQSYYFLSWSCVHFFSSVQDLKISPSLLSQSWISPESEFHCVNKKSYIVNTSCVHKKKLHGTWKGPMTLLFFDKVDSIQNYVKTCSRYYSVKYLLTYKAQLILLEALN